MPPHVAVSTDTISFEGLLEAAKKVCPKALEGVATPADARIPVGAFHLIVRAVGLSSLSPQQTQDVFVQMCISNNKGGKKVEAEDASNMSVALGDIAEWSDALVSLNCCPSGASSPKHREDSLISSGAATPCSANEPGTHPSPSLDPHQKGRLRPDSLPNGAGTHTVVVPSTLASDEATPRGLLLQFLSETFSTKEFAFADASEEQAFVRSLSQNGFQDFLRSSLSRVRQNLSLSPQSAFGVETASRRRESVALGMRDELFSASTVKRSEELVNVIANRTLAFANALSLRHVASGAGASLAVNAMLLFVDISGYSAVTTAIEHQGAHTVSSIVNRYVEEIVEEIFAFGGDVVKFAGDAILALWCEGNDKDNCISGVMCAEALQSRHGTHPVRGTSLEFGIHCGLAVGRCVSRIFSPRKLRNNDMPSHFHFLSGEPLYQVGYACALAQRGETVIHTSVLPFLDGVRIESNPTTVAEYLTVTEASAPVVWKPLKPSVKITKLSGSMQTSTNMSQSERLFIPPKVAAVLDSGMDQFFMAELRELVVLFIHFAKTTDEEVWFDEVFHILESFGCDVVQIIDDDKGVHIVAALNLYAMAEHSVDAAINIALTMRAKHCVSHIGVAEGTVFCGVVGSTLACQWDITGQACVRAARLMQHAVANNLEVCFDVSIFQSALDRSPLSSIGSISIKGTDDPVPIYTLRPLEANHRHSSFQLVEKVPTLSFYQSLCPDVHSKVIKEVRHLLRLKATPVNDMSFKGLRDHASFDEGMSSSSSSQSLSGGGRSPKHSEANNAGNVRSLQAVYSNRAVTKVVVLTGCFGTGKFCAAINALGESETISIVHQCYERQLLVQLTLVHTIAVWFSFSATAVISQAAQEVLKAFREHRQNEAFALGVDLLDVVCENAARRFCIIVRAGQFLDQSSVSFVGAIAKKFEQCEKIFCIVTCSPLYGFEEPEKKYVAAANAKVIQVSSISDEEVQKLFTHCIKQKADNALLSFVCKKTSKYVECVVELAKYLSNRALLTLSSDGYARMRPRSMDDVDALLWGDISHAIRRKAIHVLDHLTPQLLTFCKIIASITEQPLISAFFYSVNKVCQVVQNTSLDVGVVELLDSMWLLKLCEHKCTAHTGTGELDAAVFLVPAMRDVVQSLLVPQQRVEINKICGECFAETHPMNHPMQLLVRARHFLFAGMVKEYLSDMRAGFTMLQKDQGTLKDAPVIRTRFFDWIRGDIGPEELGHIFDDNAAVVKEYEAHCQLKRTGRNAAMQDGRMESRLSSTATQDMMILKMLQRLTALEYPLELAPARPAFFDIIKMVQLIVEMVDNGMSTKNALVLYEESDATVDGILDQLGASLTSYVTSLCFCLEGVVGHCTEYTNLTKKSFHEFVVMEVESEELREILRGDGNSDVSQRATAAKRLILQALTLVEDHLSEHLEPLCAVLRADSFNLIDNAHKISVAVRRRVHYTMSCALASAALVFQEHKGVVQGAIIASLFENLPSILKVYCGNSARLQRIFCDGLKEYYEGTLQPPETYELLGQKVSVFFFCWLNCCVQQLLFH